MGLRCWVFGFRFKVVVISRFDFNRKVCKGDGEGITIVGLTICSAPEKFFVTSLKDFGDHSKKYLN
jgi:hypothetical protein